MMPFLHDHITSTSMSYRNYTAAVHAKTIRKYNKCPPEKTNKMGLVAMVFTQGSKRDPVPVVNFFGVVDEILLQLLRNSTRALHRPAQKLRCYCTAVVAVSFHRNVQGEV